MPWLISPLTSIKEISWTSLSSNLTQHMSPIFDKIKNHNHEWYQHNKQVHLFIYLITFYLIYWYQKSVRIYFSVPKIEFKFKIYFYRRQKFTLTHVQSTQTIDLYINKNIFMEWLWIRKLACIDYYHYYFFITWNYFSRYNILHDNIIGIYNHIIIETNLHQLLYNTI